MGAQNTHSTRMATPPEIAIDVLSEETEQEEPVRTRLRVQNICCEMESRLVKEKLNPVDGVEKVEVNIVGRTAFVTHLASKCPADRVVSILNEAHLGASIHTSSSGSKAAEEHLPAWRSALLFSVFVGFVVGISLLAVGHDH